MRSYSLIAVAVAACMLGVVAASPVPPTWQHLGGVEAQRRVPLLIAVAHTASQDELARQCTDVSDPSSPRYVVATWAAYLRLVFARCLPDGHVGSTCVNPQPARRLAAPPPTPPPTPAATATT